MKTRFWTPAACIVLCLVGMILSGCATYYRVTDPSTDKAYYTKRVERMSGGAVRLDDARTGSEITIQNSEVKKISKEDYMTAVKGN